MRVMFVDAVSAPGESLPLSKAQLHHLRVRRHRLDQSLRIWDGQTLGLAYVDDSRLVVERLLEPAAEGFHQPQTALHVKIGAPDRPARELILQQLTQLGVASISFFQSDHTDPAEWRAAEQSVKKPRTQDLIVAACEQSGNLRPPRVEIMPERFMDRLAELGGVVAMLPREADSQNLLPPSDPPHLWIGPPGGFSAAEQTRIHNHAASVTLPGPVLKTETAAVALSALLLYRS